MMHREGFWGAILLLFAAVLVFAALPSKAFAGDPAGEDCDEACRQRMRATLRDALDKAHREGVSSVDIDVDLEPDGVQKGDLVTAHVTLLDEDGKLVLTTLEAVSKEMAQLRSAAYQDPPVFEPEEIVGGEPPGPPALGEVVLGMKKGEKKTVPLPPEKGYGLRDPRKQSTFPCVRTIPRKLRLSAEEYVGRFKRFPTVGKEVELVPYFKARIQEVTESDVSMEMLAKDGQRAEESFGTVEIKVDDRQVTIILTPQRGAVFPMQGGEGRIEAVDSKEFTVDFNHPMAGKRLTAQVEVLSIARVSQFRDMQIQWSEDHDEALARARRENRPAVLVLYADWCGWSKRVFDETFQDPRLKILKDDFVWVRVNSDKEARFKELYSQQGFPLIVLLGRDGRIARKIDGYRSGGAMRGELTRLSAGLQAGYRNMEGTNP